MKGARTLWITAKSTTAMRNPLGGDVDAVDHGRGHEQADGGGHEEDGRAHQEPDHARQPRRTRGRCRGLGLLWAGTMAGIGTIDLSTKETMSVGLLTCQCQRGATPADRATSPPPTPPSRSSSPGSSRVSLVALTLTEQFEVLPGALAAFASAYLLLRER